MSVRTLVALSVLVPVTAFAVERPTAYTTTSGSVANPTYAYDAGANTWANVQTARSCAGRVLGTTSEIIEYYSFSNAATFDLTVDHTLSFDVDAGWGNGATTSRGTYDMALEYSVNGGDDWIAVRSYVGPDAWDPERETLTVTIPANTLVDLEDLIVRPRITLTPNATCTGILGSVSGQIAVYDIVLD